MYICLSAQCARTIAHCITLLFIFSALQASTGMEDSLEDDGDIHRTCTTAVRREQSLSKTAEQAEVHLPGNRLQHKRAEPV